MSGVRRLSDFMLWQAHQDTQIVFVDCFWPQFDIWRFLPILIDWGVKRRRKQLAESWSGEEGRVNGTEVEVR